MVTKTPQGLEMANFASSNFSQSPQFSYVTIMFMLCCSSRRKRLLFFTMLSILLTAYWFILVKVSEESSLINLSIEVSASVKSLVPTEVNYQIPAPTTVAVAVKLFVVVCSAVNNQAARSAIRSSWGRDSRTLSGVRVVFIVGKPIPKHIHRRRSLESLPRSSMDRNIKQNKNSGRDYEQYKIIKKESMTYGDMFLEDFVDSYNNLALKSVALLDRVTKGCRMDMHNLFIYQAR